jgi:G3E family GTPase
LDVRGVVTTATASQLLDTRYVSAPVYRAQLATADAVVLTAPSAVTQDERTAARQALVGMIPSGTRIIEDANGLELDVLEIKPP